MRFEMTGTTLGHTLGVEETRQQAIGGLDGHALVPTSPPAQLDIGGRGVLFYKAAVSEGDRFAVVEGGNLTKVLVVGVGSAPGPIHDLATIVQQGNELDPDDPTVIGFALFAELLLRTALALGVNELDAKAVENREEGRVVKEIVGEVAVVGEQPVGASEVRQGRKEVAEIP